MRMRVAHVTLPARVLLGATTCDLRIETERFGMSLPMEFPFIFACIAGNEAALCIETLHAWLQSSSACVKLYDLRQHRQLRARYKHGHARLHEETCISYVKRMRNRIDRQRVRTVM
jgi:hypothetical protein